MRTCSVRRFAELPAPPQPSTGCRNVCLSTKGMLNDAMRHEIGANCPVEICEVHKASLSQPCSSSVPPPAPPSAAQQGLMTHGFHHAKTMACDCLARSTTCTKRASLGSSCAPPTPTTGCRNSSGASSSFFVSTGSLFLLSTSSCFCRRWTCDRRWDKRKHNATTRGGVHIHSGCRPRWAALRGKLRLPHPKPLTSSTLQTSPLDKRWCVLLTTVTRLAWVEQHRPRREADGIGHQNDELLRHEPAHVAHRQPEAVPEEPEEQCVDLLQVVSEPNLRWSNACLNFHHFENSERWLP